MRSVSQAIVKNKKVLVRLDLDVKIENGVVTNDYRLKQSLKTLNNIIENGGFPIILGHLGRPEGKFVKELSTNILSPWFEKNLKKDDYALLENVRFNVGEELNDHEYALQLAAHGEIFVNESFATAHRMHASTYEIAKILPSFAGLNFVSEVNTILNFVNNAEHPLISIVGGVKLETKQQLINKLAKISHYVLVGGTLGISLKDPEQNVIIPTDYSPENKDIGPITINKFSEIISTAKTIIFNGPVGLYEDKRYEQGTISIINAIKQSNAKSLIGGGDTVDAIQKFAKVEDFTFVSTGGGAMTELIVKGTLPGIEVLNG